MTKLEQSIRAGYEKITDRTGYEEVTDKTAGPDYRVCQHGACGDFNTSLHIIGICQSISFSVLYQNRGVILRVFRIFRISQGAFGSLSSVFPGG